MKITVKQAIVAANAINEVSKTTFSGLISYKIAKIDKAIKPLIECYQEAEKKLFDEFGEFDKEFGQKIIRPTNPKFKDYEAESEKIMSQEEEITAPEIKFCDLEKFDVPPVFYIGLEPFITEE